MTATLLRPEISLYVKIAGLRAEGDARCVLDLGCSAGALGAAVGRSFGEAKPLVIGMDASPTMLSAVPAPVA